MSKFWFDLCAVCPHRILQIKYVDVDVDGSSMETRKRQTTEDSLTVRQQSIDAFK